MAEYPLATSYFYCIKSYVESIWNFRDKIRNIVSFYVSILNKYHARCILGGEKKNRGRLVVLILDHTINIHT